MQQHVRHNNMWDATNTPFTSEPKWKPTVYKSLNKPKCHKMFLKVKWSMGAIAKHSRLKLNRPCYILSYQCLSVPRNSHLKVMNTVATSLWYMLISSWLLCFKNKPTCFVSSENSSCTTLILLLGNPLSDTFLWRRNTHDVDPQL